MDSFHTVVFTDIGKWWGLEMVHIFHPVVFKMIPWKMLKKIPGFVTLFLFVCFFLQHPSLLQYLFYHKLFTLSCCNLFVLFILGIHRRVMAPQMYPWLLENRLDVNKIYFNFIILLYFLASQRWQNGGRIICYNDEFLWEGWNNFKDL